jgi:hypothetical protein
MADAVEIDPQRVEALGPAERTVRALSTFTDHLVHNRPGLVTPDARTNIGVRWAQATWRKQDDGSRVVFLVTKAGKKTVETRVGILSDDGKTVTANGRPMGEFRNPGLFPEVAVYLYRQIADVFKMDNEFAARWASFAFTQDRKDLKTVLAAFMLTQDRKGDPHIENGEVLFTDDDYRSVGEAMILRTEKGARLQPKQVLLIGEVLRLPEIHAINREMGFSKSAKNPQMRRYKKAAHKWLRFREENPKMLDGLVKSGQGGMVRDLAKRTGYKPSTEAFFKALRWRQKQAADGRRSIALDMEIEAAESWEGLTEAEICERIVTDKPKWKVLVGRLPEGTGLTRAIVAAAVEAGALSDKDLIILTPTLEDLGLLAIEPVASAWKGACQRAEDQRARNIARNVKSKEAKEGLEEAADVATAKAIEKVTRDLRIYFIIDKSGSMGPAIEAAKRCLTKFLGGFPLDRTHVSVFNTFGTEVRIQSPRSAAVEHAFRGHTAGGGTRYSEGVRALQHYKPNEGEDVLFIFVGDEQGESGPQLAENIRRTGLNPVGFGLLRFGRQGPNTVRTAANSLGIPCFQIEETLFDDPYAVTNTLTNLIATTPVGHAPVGRPVPKRVTLVEQILKTPLLEKPVWA